MTVHRLKCWPRYFLDVQSGIKKFEIRRNDRDFRVADELVLVAYDPESKRETGPSLTVRVTYLVDLTPLGCPGFVAMSWA